MHPTTIHDPAFSQSITVADAYRALELFVSEYNARGESSTLALVADLGLVHDGGSSDPAQLADFLSCVRRVLGHTA